MESDGSLLSPFLSFSLSSSSSPLESPLPATEKKPFSNVASSSSCAAHHHPPLSFMAARGEERRKAGGRGEGRADQASFAASLSLALPLSPSLLLSSMRLLLPLGQVMPSPLLPLRIDSTCSPLVLSCLLVCTVTSEEEDSFSFLFSLIPPEREDFLSRGEGERERGGRRRFCYTLPETIYHHEEGGGGGGREDAARGILSNTGGEGRKKETRGRRRRRGRLLKQKWRGRRRKAFFSLLEVSS